MRDRLRAVQCPSDIIDQIGGWQTAGVGQSYGNGYTLEVLHEWMSKLQGTDGSLIFDADAGTMKLVW
jgi:hypothetical protein